MGMKPRICIHCEGPVVGRGLRHLCADCNQDWRWCNKCQQLKEIGEFTTPGGTVLRYCYQCKLDGAKAFRQTPEGKLEEYISHLVTKFKISRTKARELASQTSCSICGLEPDERLHIDHNHATGCVRDALCRRCNYGISVLEQDIEWLAQAQRYLARHSN